jgi:hypothetical protein
MMSRCGMTRESGGGRPRRVIDAPCVGDITFSRPDVTELPGFEPKRVCSASLRLK